MQNKENPESQVDDDNETFSFIYSNQIGNTNNPEKILNDKVMTSYHSLDDTNKNINFVYTVNKIIKNGKFDIFKNIFMKNKKLFFKSIFGISSINESITKENFSSNNYHSENFNINNNSTNFSLVDDVRNNFFYHENPSCHNEFSFILHVCINNNLFCFVELILYETKLFIEDYIKGININFFEFDNKNANDIYKDIASKQLKFSENLFLLFINRVDNFGYSPLHYAITTGNTKLISLLIENKADLRQRTKNGFNALHLVASLNKLEIFILFYERNANIFSLEDKDYQDNTILHIACYNGAIDIFEYLIAKNVNINSVDKKGNTPLHYAVYHGRVIMKLI